jgi:hypothetical protein
MRVKASHAWGGLCLGGRIECAQRRLAAGFACGALACAIILSGWTAAHAQAPGDKRPMISLVALSNSYTEFDTGTVSRKLDELYPGKFLPPNQQENFVVGGPSPKPLLIKSTMPGRAGMFMLLSAAAPYTEFSDFARFITDTGFRRKAETQAAWFSIDRIGKIGSSDDAYRFIAAALIKLAPDDAVIVVKPETRAAMVLDDALRRQLAEGRVP